MSCDFSNFTFNAVSMAKTSISCSYTVPLHPIYIIIPMKSWTMYVTCAVAEPGHHMCVYT